MDTDHCLVERSDHVLVVTLNRPEAKNALSPGMLAGMYRAWRRLDDVPLAPQTRPWLYGVARRLLANHRRGEGRRHALATKLRNELSETPPDHQPLQDDTPAARAFRALPEQDRELLSLVAWEELDTAQLATVLGISRNAVRIRLHRARKRFAKLLTAPLANRSVVALSEEVSHEDA